MPQRPQQDARLITRLKALGEQYPRYGYLMLHGLLRAEGLVENRKRTYRSYTELGMQVRTKRRKKLVRPRVPMAVPTRSNERWSMGFVHDQLADGRRIRVLNIVDDYSRVCVGQLVDLSISGVRLVRYLNQLRATPGLPRTVVLDNGPERLVRRCSSGAWKPELSYISFNPESRPRTLSWNHSMADSAMDA